MSPLSHEAESRLRTIDAFRRDQTIINAGLKIAYDHRDGSTPLSTKDTAALATAEATAKATISAFLTKLRETRSAPVDDDGKPLSLAAAIDVMNNCSAVHLADGRRWCPPQHVSCAATLIGNGQKVRQRIAAHAAAPAAALPSPADVARGIAATPAARPAVKPDLDAVRATMARLKAGISPQSASTSTTTTPASAKPTPEEFARMVSFSGSSARARAQLEAWADDGHVRRLAGGFYRLA